jgi:hypothetical protein
VVIRKADIDASVEEKNNLSFRAFSRQIDEALMRGERRIDITGRSAAVVELVIKAYRDNGWTVKPKIGFFQEYLEFS